MMKPEFCIVGTFEGNAHIFTGKDFVRDGWSEAKRWKTHAGAVKAIEAEKAAGSDWAMFVIFAPASAASSLGKLAAGKPKQYGLDELVLRAERMAAARAKRWPVKKETEKKLSEVAQELGADREEVQTAWLDEMATLHGSTKKPKGRNAQAG